MWRINFNHPRPMQSNMQEMLSSIPMQNLLIPSKLQTNDNLVSLLKSKLSESENNIQYISDYGIRVLPEDVLKALTPESKENILRRDHILCTFGEEFMADFVLLFYE